MIPAVGYLRVSGRGQVDGDGFPRQQEAITRYAQAHDTEILDWYRDEGISGKTELENRAGLAACLERIENNGAKLVIVESADRLARDAMVSEIIVRQFQKAGGTIVTASGVNLTEGDDSNPTSALIRGVLALIAEFDRRVIVLKLRAARQRMKQKQGRCEGAKPYGSTDDERQILAAMGFWRAQGLTFKQIASSLNTQGLKTRSGRLWHIGSVAKILNRQQNVSKDHVTFAQTRVNQ